MWLYTDHGTCWSLVKSTWKFVMLLLILILIWNSPTKLKLNLIPHLGLFLTQHLKSWIIQNKVLQDKANITSPIKVMKNRERHIKRNFKGQEKFEVYAYLSFFCSVWFLPTIPNHFQNSMQNFVFLFSCYSQQLTTLALWDFEVLINYLLFLELLLKC